MLKYVLGIVIDSQGNYLSFGKTGDSDSYYMSLHGPSLLMAVYQNQWHLSHPDLTLQNFDFSLLLQEEFVVMLDAEIHSYFMKWNALGYLLLLNRSFEDFPIMIGFIPYEMTQEQMDTLKYLKGDILFSENIDSNLYYPNQETISIFDLYEKINQKKRN